MTRTLRKCSLPLLLLALALALAAPAPARAEEEGPLAGLRVLVVSSPDGEWIGELLSERGARVTAASWGTAGVEKARAFDLLVVGGGRRGVTGIEVKGYDVPVLGVGSCGYGYFGSMRLKHGAPFS